MKRIYLAAPLFSLAEKAFNISLRNELKNILEEADIILPQERSGTLLDLENGPQLVFEDCIKMIDSSDIVLGILDGSDADSGTCMEIGYAFAKGIPVIGIRTDFRDSEEKGLNLMLAFSCNILIWEPSWDLPSIAKEAAIHINRIG